MKVKKLIELLQHFDKELEVTISDGYETIFYSGDYSVELFHDKGKDVVDIGVGGCRENQW